MVPAPGHIRIYHANGVRGGPTHGDGVAVLFLMNHILEFSARARSQSASLTINGAPMPLVGVHRWLRKFNLGEEVSTCLCAHLLVCSYTHILVHLHAHVLAHTLNVLMCLYTNKSSFPMQAYLAQSEKVKHDFDSPYFDNSSKRKSVTWWRQDVGCKIARTARMIMVRRLPFCFRFLAFLSFRD